MFPPSMIIRNLHVVGVSVAPHKTDTPLVVDAYTVQPRSVTFQLMNSVTHFIEIQKHYLVDVVLLPVEGSIGLDDDVFVRVLLEFVDEHGLAWLERFGNFRMHAKRNAGALGIGGGHLARLGLDFVAQRRRGFHHAGAGAVRARLAEHAFERLLGALAGDANETEFVEGKCFRRRLVLLQGLLQGLQDFFAVAALFHVDEVHDDDAAEIAEANLTDDFLDGFEVGLDDGVLKARGALANELARVDVNGHERLGVVDDDIAAGLEPHFGAQSLVEFVLDAELFEDGRFLSVELDLADELGLEMVHEIDDFAVFLFAIDPDGREVVADVIAQHAFDEVEVAVDQGRSFALLAALLDFHPGFA